MKLNEDQAERLFDILVDVGQLHYAFGRLAGIREEYLAEVTVESPLKHYYFSTVEGSDIIVILDESKNPPVSIYVEYLAELDEKYRLVEQLEEFIAEYNADNH